MILFKRKPAPREAEAHDWSKREYMATPHGGGKRLSMVAWSDDGPIPQERDYLILRNGERTTRYRVDEVKRAIAEGDVVSLSLTFAPRVSSGADS